MSLGWVRESLEEMREKGLLRDPPVIEDGPSGGRAVTVGGASYVSFGSNDYLGLAGDPRLRQAASAAALTWGAGSGSSRLIVGTLRIHRQLEEAIAGFKGVEDACLFSTGYQAGVGAVMSLAGAGDSVILDKLSHACLVDGARASGARVRVYPHLDIVRLADRLARESGSRRRLIVTDSLFSMDGDIAPLADILALAESHDATLLVDEAHATGVIGPDGRGLVAELGLASPRLVQMGTLSKALGSQGGFLAGERGMVDYLRNTARSLMYTTAPVPAAVGAGIEAIRLLEEDSPLPTLRGNVELFARACPALRAITPIVPVVVGEAARALDAQRRLRERGLWVPAVRPPTVALGASRLRISISAAHTAEDIDLLAKALHDLGLAE